MSHRHLELILQIEAHLLEFNLSKLILLLQNMLRSHTLCHLNLDVSYQIIIFTTIRDTHKFLQSQRVYSIDADLH